MLKVFANYGAMFPTHELVIKSINAGLALAIHEDGHEEQIEIARIRHERPISGSPIGLYWNERDAY